MLIDIPITINFDPEVLVRIDTLVGLLQQTIQKENAIMSTLDDIVTAVAAQTTMIGSLQTFVQGLEDQIKALPGLTPAMQAKIDTIFAGVDANEKAIANAMVVNVPPPGPPAQVQQVKTA